MIIKPNSVCNFVQILKFSINMLFMPKRIVLVQPKLVNPLLYYSQQHFQQKINLYEEYWFALCSIESQKSSYYGRRKSTLVKYFLNSYNTRLLETNGCRGLSALTISYNPKVFCPKKTHTQPFSLGNAAIATARILLALCVVW